MTCGSAARSPFLPPQAALLEQWLIQFGNAESFAAVVVESEGSFVAALPMLRSRMRGMLSVATMSSNPWTPSSDLLVDGTADDEAFDALAGGLIDGPWSLLWLDFAIIDSQRWQKLIDACQRQGYAVNVHPHFLLPKIDIAGTWEEYRGRWSRNHRQNLSRTRRNLENDHGAVSLRLLQPQDGQQIAELLAQGFAIEDRSWKGAAGSSVLRTTGMLNHFTAQARLLAQRGQLEIAFLDVADRPIAFLYGWHAKGVFHAFKTGYDEGFASYSPGQLIIHDVLQSYFRTGSHRAFDCVGPVSPATARWQTSNYQAGRIVIAPQRLMGQAAFFAYKHLAPALRHWRKAISERLVQDRENVALAKDE